MSSTYIPDKNVERVRPTILKSPNRSARKHSIALEIDNRTLRDLLHVDLRFHLYKLAVVQKVNVSDSSKGLRFAQETLTLFDANEQTMLFMSDETQLNLNGTVNKQNSRYWAAKTHSSYTRNHCIAPNSLVCFDEV